MSQGAARSRSLRVGAAAGLMLIVGLMTQAMPAAAVDQPGGPCSTNGAFQQLGAGWIQCVNGTWQPSSGPSGSPTTPSTAPTQSAGGAAVKPMKGWSTVGAALTPATFGSGAGQVADPSAIRLSSGRVKVFVFVAEEGLRSATSTTSRGTAFVADAGRPVPWTMAGQPRVVPLGGSSMRLFYVANGSINAARSTDDGASFTDEGPVITAADAGFEPGGLTVIKVHGGYRGYFSNLEKPGVRADRVIRTATSPDMLHWTMGPVITGSGGALAEGGSHPFALVDRHGRIALYYSADRGSYYGILVSTSRDGITFSKERSVISRGGDGDLLPTGAKGGLLYYGADLGGGAGFGVKVATTKASLVP